MIHIEIPLDALTKSNVARALADLTLALGGHKADAPVAKPVVSSPPAASPYAPPSPVYTPPAVTPVAAAARAAKPAKPAKAAKPAKPAKPAKARPATGKTAPRPELEGLSSEARWSSYFNALPENSKRFLTLLEQQGKLTLPDAVVKLGLPSPKAMGGLTGAMARWAPKQGIKIPYDTLEDSNGTRYWVWRGVK
jgi:hypothetical protein